VDEIAGTAQASGEAAPPNPALSYPYDFDPAARERATRFSVIRKALAIYTPDLLLLPFIFLLTVTGWWASVRDRALALRLPLLPGEVWAGLVFVLFFVAIIWLVNLAAGVLMARDLRKELRRPQRTAEDFLDRVRVLPLLTVQFLVLCAVFYGLLWFTPAWWLVIALVLGAFTLAQNARILQRSRDTAGASSVPSGLRQRFDSLVRAVGAPWIAIATSKDEKPTAFTFGMGRSQTVVLSKAVIGKMHPLELDVVMAHEIGHIVNRDLARKTAVGAALGLATLGILAILLESAVGRFGITSRWDIASLPLVFLYLRIAAVAFAPLSNLHSQRLELAADRFALGLLGDPVAYMSAQKRLADMDFVESSPSTVTRLFSTHPSIEERLELAERRERGPPER
jgi:Zn-dependent protease with chaperone function